MSVEPELVGWARIVEMRPYPHDLKQSYLTCALENTPRLFDGGDEKELEENPERIAQFLKKSVYDHRTAIILIRNLRPDAESGLHFLPSHLINLYGFSVVDVHCTSDISAYGISLYSLDEIKRLRTDLKQELSFWPTKSDNLLKYFE